MKIHVTNVYNMAHSPSYECMHCSQMNSCLFDLKYSVQIFFGQGSNNCFVSFKDANQRRQFKPKFFRNGDLNRTICSLFKAANRLNVII